MLNCCFLSLQYTLLNAYIPRIYCTFLHYTLQALRKRLRLHGCLSSAVEHNVFEQYVIKVDSYLVFNDNTMCLIFQCFSQILLLALFPYSLLSTLLVHSLMAFDLLYLISFSLHCIIYCTLVLHVYLLPFNLVTSLISPRPPSSYCYCTISHGTIGSSANMLQCPNEIKHAIREVNQHVLQ